MLSSRLNEVGKMLGAMIRNPSPFLINDSSDPQTSDL